MRTIYDLITPEVARLVAQASVFHDMPVPALKSGLSDIARLRPPVVSEALIRAMRMPVAPPVPPYRR